MNGCVYTHCMVPLSICHTIIMLLSHRSLLYKWSLFFFLIFFFSFLCFRSNILELRSPHASTLESWFNENTSTNHLKFTYENQSYSYVYIDMQKKQECEYRLRRRCRTLFFLTLCIQCFCWTTNRGMTCEAHTRGIYSPNFLLAWTKCVM